MKETKIAKEVEKKFLGIRGWKDWEEYDRIIESSQLDKNVRGELISICIDQTLKDVCEEIEKWGIKNKFIEIDDKKNKHYEEEFFELLKKFQGEEE